MKTAMKNLIEKIAYENEFGTWMTGLVEDSNISDMVEKALKEERQQIEDAYDQGNWDAASHKPDVINGKIYFTQTHEQ